MKFSERLVYLRERSGKTQEEIAAILGVARTTYAMYEQGRREPDLTMVGIIAETFNVSLDYLVGINREDGKDGPFVEEEKQFLEWVKSNISSAFFYDFDAAPDERKKLLMQDLRYLWERDTKSKQK